MEENKTQNNNDIPVLRTYTSDMADAIKNKNMTVIKIAVAEKERAEKNEPEKIVVDENKSSKFFFVAGGIILIVGAIVGSYFLFQNKKNSSQAPVSVINDKTLISYDSKIFLDVTNINDTKDLISLISKNEIKNSGLIKAVFITRKINAVPEIINSQNFFSLFGINAPGSFTRSLSEKFLLGKYSLQNKNSTFLIFQTKNYGQTYGSILEWEKTMVNDLSVLFNLKNYSFNQQWRDLVIDNKDVRVLYGENGEGILYYVFVNKNNLVITENQEALKEIILRLLINNSK